MDGYGKPGYTREEFEREMDAELDRVSSIDREYQEDGLTRLFQRLGPPPTDRTARK